MKSFEHELEILHNLIVEQIVNQVWAKYSENETARLRVYDRIADSFAGMVRALSAEETPIIDKTIKETEDEEPST